MTGDDGSGNGPEGNAGQRDTRSGAGLPPPGVSRLLAHKIELPDPVEGYIQRPELEARCVLTDQRLTVLHAPGGFGKTALLARCCRTLRERSVTVAWLSLDEEDEPGSVARYLLLAFERAGVEIVDTGAGRAGDAATAAPGAEADSQADFRIDLLLRALERHGEPCVLTLDEIERMRSPEAVTALNALLRHAPVHFCSAVDARALATMLRRPQTGRERGSEHS